MRTPRTHARIFCLLFFAVPSAAVLALGTAPAAARPNQIEGVVTAATSRWTTDGSRIVTEATIATPGGDVTVSQLGGTVDGLTMRTMPGPALLQPGMKVAVAAHAAADLSARSSLVVDEVAVTGGFEFVRTGPTKGGKSLYWKSGCVQVTLDAAGTTALPAQQEADVVRAVIAHWNTSIASCSYMNIVEEPSKEVEVGRDFINVIKFRDTSWCRPAVGDDPMRCYSTAAAGLTTVVYVDDPSSSRDGEIVDADVELNGVNFDIVTNKPPGSGCVSDSDLANTLTHELGHLLGLEHTCLFGNDPPRTDGAGNAVLSCDSLLLPRDVPETTMFPSQTCGEIKKTTLEPDDINSMCVIYPIDDDPRTCGEVGGTDEGCCSAQPNVPGMLFLLLTTGALIWSRGRAPRRRS